jgi:hypothetical protein
VKWAGTPSSLSRCSRRSAASSAFKDRTTSRLICQFLRFASQDAFAASPGGGERKAGASRAADNPAMNEDEDELDLSTLRPNFRAWLIKTADMNFDRFEAVHGDQAASIALIAELMTAQVVYGAWEDRKSVEGGFRFVIIKGRDLLSKRDKTVHLLRAPVREP